MPHPTPVQRRRWRSINFKCNLHPMSRNTKTAGVANGAVGIYKDTVCITIYTVFKLHSFMERFQTSWNMNLQDVYLARQPGSGRYSSSLVSDREKQPHATRQRKSRIISPQMSGKRLRPGLTGLWYQVCLKSIDLSPFSHIFPMEMGIWGHPPFSDRPWQIFLLRKHQLRQYLIWKLHVFSQTKYSKRVKSCQTTP